MRVNVLIFLYITTFLLGCGEVGSIELKTEKNTTQLQQENKILKKLGININGEQITFDINKTTDFLQKVEIEMHSKADEIQHKIEKADINFTRDMGLTLSDEKVEIDFNKTRKMFQEINILMKEVLLDTNRS
jgi:predicted RNA binding protein with dsRBD fold (UPF0201 family)